MIVPTFWNIKLRYVLILLIFGASLLFSNNRDCPENFISNPQYPASGPECFPDEFLFYSSTSIAYYYFLSATINDFSISENDWVGAFSCNQWENDVCIDFGPCVGSRQWGECDLGTGCDVPVFGDDGSDFTENYLLTNEIPVFKIYDSSNNIYINANPSENIPWQYLSNPSLDQLSASYDITGCTDDNGINFDPYANIDDGSCIVENIPDLFEFNQSTSQAFYFFQNVTIDNISLTENDWVGAFNGNVCIGARRWDIQECNDQICDIPIMGNDGEEYSVGYIQNGQFPTFKIFDYSENSYYDAIPSSSEPWQNFGLVYIDNLYAFSIIPGCTDLNACNYNQNATNDDGSCEYPEENYDCDGNCVTEIDCAGICGGDTLIDECGVCDGDGAIYECGCNDIFEDFCDCNNNILDECGVCGGPGSVYECGCFDIPDGQCDCNGNIEDECGICDGPGLNEDGCCGSEVLDCNNICGGDAILDQCGVCDNNIYNDCIQDCAGIWGGDSEYDDCGICNGENSDQDCNGVCFGSAVEDECGVCNGDGSICNAPIANSQLLEALEDTTIEFNLNASDPNNDLLEIIIISNPIHGNFTIINENSLLVSYTPNNNYFGLDQLLYQVSDNSYTSDIAEISFNINEVFDAPIVSDMTIDVLEDVTSSIDLSSYDADSDDNNLIFTIIDYPNYGTLIEDRAIATYLYTPNLNYIGEDQFIYSVSDGEIESQATVYINIINVNDPPESNGFDFTGLSLVDFNQYIYDIDNDPLTIQTIPPSFNQSLLTLFGNELIPTGEEHIYSYTPIGDFDILLYKVNDGVSASNVSTAIYDSRISSNRDFPIALNDEVDMQEDNQFQISFFAFDYDAYLNGDPSIEITMNPQNGTLGTLSSPNISGVVAEWTSVYTPNENYFGNDLITFSVTDDNGDSSVLDGEIIITINPVNDSPILSEIPNLEFNEDFSYTLDLSSTDVDNDNLFYNISDGNNIQTNIDNNSIIFIPDGNWHGFETFAVSVSDGELEDYQSINVTVFPINDTPILITDLSNIILDEDTTLEVELYAVDIEGDHLIYSFPPGNNPPDWINASLNDNILLFSPDENMFGSYSSQIYISDGQTQTTPGITVTVNSINDAPIIISTSPNQIDANDAYYYSVEVEDVDNNNFIYGLLDQPDGMIINNNGDITWDNIPENIYFEQFVISVSDNITTVYESISLNIIQFYDCNGIANGLAIEDCAGICNGLSEYDECGICNGDNSTCSGCTNNNACNYNQDAIFDDGSCEFSTYPFNCDGSCINDEDNDDICDELEIYGCTDPFASNYDIFATENDGTCIQECDTELYLDEFNFHQFEFNGSISASVLINGEQNGSVNDILLGYIDNEIRGYVQGNVFPLTGEIIFSLMLYSSQASGENISFKYFHAASNQTFCLNETIEFTSDMIIGNALDPFIFNIQEEYILGCTDNNACNYNLDANFDDGSCEYPDEYFDCNGICLNDSDEDSICDEVDICDGSSNLDTDNDGICNENDPCIGYDNNNDEDADGVCDDYDPCYGFSNIDSDGDGLCNDQEVEGCSDPEACNYNPDTTEEGNCIYAEEYYDCNQDCLNDIDEDDVCDELELIGCTDNNACNYNPAATDEGDCEYAEEYYDCEGECIVEIDCEGICGGDSFIDDCGECVVGDTPSDDCLNIQLPTEFSLSQNYPNPFNPITSIDYTIPNSGEVKIFLYDVMGTKVKTVVDKFHSPGYFTITLSSEDLHSGIYILKLISQENIFTRKIAVVK